MATDLLGQATTELESEVLGVYEQLKATLRREDLPPCVEANLRGALVACWNAVNDLGLVFEQLLDFGA